MFKWHQQTYFLLLVGCAALFVYSVTLFFSGYMSGQQVGYAAARQKVAEVFPAPTEPTYQLNGTIQEILPDSLVIDAQRVTANPLEDGPKVRTVTITNDTKLRHVKLKTPQQLDADAAVYSQKLEETYKQNAAAPAAPLPYELFAIEWSDLKQGDRVEVRSSTDVRTAATITATEIYRHPDAQ